IRQEQMQITVVVIVEELQSPSAHQASRLAHSILHRHIVESLIVVVLIERIHSVIDIGDEKVHPAVLIEIRPINSHAGPRASLCAILNPPLLPNLLETAAAVHEEK